MFESKFLSFVKKNVSSVLVILAAFIMSFTFMFASMDRSDAGQTYGVYASSGMNKTTTGASALTLKNKAGETFSTTAYLSAELSTISSYVTFKFTNDTINIQDITFHVYSTTSINTTPKYEASVDVTNAKTIYVKYSFSTSATSPSVSGASTTTATLTLPYSTSLTASNGYIGVEQYAIGISIGSALWNEDYYYSIISNWGRAANVYTKSLSSSSPSSCGASQSAACKNITLKYQYASYVNGVKYGGATSPTNETIKYFITTSSSPKSVENSSTATVVYSSRTIKYANIVLDSLIKSKTGYYYIFAEEMKDVAGRSGYGTLSSVIIDSKYYYNIGEYYIDGVSPSVSTSGGDGVQKSHSVTLTASDSYSGVADIYYCWSNSTSSCTGQSTAWSSTTSSSVTTSLSGLTGVYYLVYYSHDKAGNASSITYKQVTLDNTGPTVSLSGSSSYARSYTNIPVSISDTYSNLATIHYCWGTASYSCNAGGYTAYASANLTAAKSTTHYLSSPTGLTGTYYLNVYAKDALGNSMSPNPVSFLFDNTAPTVTSNASSSYAKSHSVTLTGTDSHSGIGNVYYCWSSSNSSCTGLSTGWTTGNGTVTTASPTGLTGTYYLRYYATDKLGNSSLSYNYYSVVYFDNTAPTVTSNASSSYAKSHSVTLTGSDSHSGIGNVYYCWSSSNSSCTGLSTGWTTGNGSVTTTSPSSLTGTYFLRYYATDKLGNSSLSYNYYSVVYFDNTAPTVTSNASGSYAKKHTIVLTGSDSHSGIGNVYYCWTPTSNNCGAGSGWGTGNGTVTLNSSEFGFDTYTGTYYLMYYGTDKVSNSSSTTQISVYFDNTAPTFSFSYSDSVTALEDSWTKGTRTLKITSASDSHSGLNSSSYCFIASSSSSSCSWGSATTKEFSTNTNATWYAHVKDDAGNIKTSSGIAVKVGKTVPKYTGFSGGSSTWTNSSRTLSGTGGAAGYAPLHSSAYCFSTSSSSCSSWQSSSTLTISSNTSATYYLHIRDKAGNTYTSASGQTVKVDVSAPNAPTFTTFTKDQIDFTNAVLNIPMTNITDNYISGIKSVTLTNSGTYASNVGTFPISAINSSKQLVFTYTVTDNAGNVTSASKTIAVNIDANKIKEKLTADLKTSGKLKADLVSASSGTALTYTAPSAGKTMIDNLSKFGVDASTLEMEYIFVNSSITDGSKYAKLAKTTSYATISSSLSTPKGFRGNDSGVATLVLVVNSEALVIGQGTITAVANAKTLASSFDTVTETGVSYLGASVGSDGSLVSINDETASSMAITLGSNNKVEKRDVYGNLEWTRAITSSGKINLVKVINNENGILVLGETTSGNVNGKQFQIKGSNDVLVVKLDNKGNILFTQVVGTKGFDEVISGTLSEDKVVVVTKNALITMNSEGHNVETRVVSNMNITNVSLNESKIALVGTSTENTVSFDNNEVVIGNVGSTDGVLMLVENNELSWVRRIGGEKEDMFYSLAMDNNDIYVVGNSKDVVLYDNVGRTNIIENRGEEDGLIIRYNMEGDLVQLSTLGGNGNDTFTQIMINKDEVIIAGLSSSDVITASHTDNGYFNINKLGDVDTLIVTMSKDLIIKEGMNLTGEEGAEVQEIGINQYTEQLMILSSGALHTQKVIESTFDYEVVVENGMLRVEANEEVKVATLSDGEELYEIGNGIEVKEGAYELRIVSANGEEIVEVINVEHNRTVVIEDVVTVERNVLPIIIASVSILTLVLVLILVRRRKVNAVA